MKKKPFVSCPKCLSHVNENLSHCPLCGSFIQEVDGVKLNLSYPKPSYQTIAKSKNQQAFFVFLSLSVLVLLLMVFLNLVIPEWPWTWTLLVLTVIVYVWILITNTILAQITVGRKLLWQSLGVSFVLIAINDLISPDFWWSITYAIPLIVMGNTLTLLSVILFVKRQPKDDYRYLLFFILLNFAYTLLSLFGYSLFWNVFGYLTFGIGFLAILGIVTLGNRNFIRFIKSWFHL